MEKLSSIERLRQKREKLDAQIQSAEARIKVTKRKQDTRRKILIGSYYLDLAIKNGTLDELKKIMDGYLTRESDKKLFETAETVVHWVAAEKTSHTKNSKKTESIETKAVS
ncbi:MAG: hypothetical protein SFW07_05780 [Gammaproteobacteria bacterium]|nr:hypothetical protein [Gammaproteobacteria bacterium]